MPMVRGSSMMSLGTWTRRSTKYQRFLNLSNVFLLIVSTGLLFSSIVLMSFYHMTKVGETVRVFAVAVTQLSHVTPVFYCKLYYGPSVVTNINIFSYFSGLGISTPSPCACWPSASTHLPCLSTDSSSPLRSPGLVELGILLMIVIVSV